MRRFIPIAKARGFHGAAFGNCGGSLEPLQIENLDRSNCPDYLECPNCHIKINKSWGGFWD